MANQNVSLDAESEQFAASLIASGKFASTGDVVHAAIDALRQRLDDDAFDEACIRAAEEGEASGLAGGDIFERIAAEYGWNLGPAD